MHRKKSLFSPVLNSPDHFEDLWIMARSMTINQVLDQIMSSEEFFDRKFIKKDGSITVRKCRRKIKHADQNNRPTENSNFKYSLRDQWSLLLEMKGYETPRTVKVFSILGLNSCENIVF